MDAVTSSKVRAISSELQYSNTERPVESGSKALGGRRREEMGTKDRNTELPERVKADGQLIYFP